MLESQGPRVKMRVCIAREPSLLQIEVLLFHVLGRRDEVCKLYQAASCFCMQRPRLDIVVCRWTAPCFVLARKFGMVNKNRQESFLLSTSVRYKKKAVEAYWEECEVKRGLAADAAQTKFGRM